MPRDADRQLLFEGFSLDLVNERVLRDGKVVALTPKAFTVLRRLAQDAGELVTKAELLRAGWARTHVTGGVLKVSILEIRRALDDDSAAPRVIETVPRRGYRFIARRVRQAGVAGMADPTRELVGRERVIAQLDDRLASALAGERQIVFVSGEAGIGKTAALDAFVARAASNPDLLIARGGCLEHYGAAEAYLPVLEAVGRLLREPGAERVMRVLETHAPSWLAQLPWLGGRVDHASAAREFLGIAKERMSREMVEAVERLTATSPLLLVLEDLHWSDHSTLDLLRMVARRTDPAQLLIVGSYRPADETATATAPPLRPLIQELRVRGQCEDIALTFLREPHVAAYLERRFDGSAFPPELVHAVHQRTEGNPLFMVRLVDELCALRVLERSGRWRLTTPIAEIVRTVPRSLRALIDMQIDRLRPDAQRVLEAASILGNEFTAASVAAGLDMDPITIEDRCDALARDAHFLAAAESSMPSDGTAVARYRFTHSMYPDVLIERVSTARRRRLHQRVGEWLEHTYGAHVTTIAGPLAWHFEEARDCARATRYLVLAAENAAGRFAYADALRLLEQARSLVPHLPADARTALDVELLQRIGDTHYGRGAWSECADAYETAVARAADGPTSARVHALRGLIRPFGVLDPDRGIAAIEEAARLSATVNDPLLQARTEMLAAAIRLAYDTWRTQDWQVCAAANATIHRLSADGVPAFDRASYAQLQVLRGEYTDAFTSLDASVPKTSESASIMVPMLALSVRAHVLLLSGRLGELLHLLRAGRRAAETNGNEPWLFVAREAWLRAALLDFAGARDLCDAMAARTTAAYWRGPSQSIGGVTAGYAALGQAKYEEASRSFTNVLDLKKTPKFYLHWLWRMHAELGIGNVSLASGNVRKARIDTDRFLQSAFSTAEPNLHALAWDLDARVAMAGKDWTGAEEKIENGLAVLRKFEIPTTAWRVHATRSALYRHAKDEAAAEAERSRAEAIIMTLADSFAPDEPLRHAFLDAAPIRRIRRARPRRGARI